MFNISKTPIIESETVPGFLVSPITIFPDIVKKDLAEEQGVNYSKVFQTALMDYLGINKT